MTSLLNAFLGIGAVSFACLVVLLVALRVNVRYCLHAAGRMDDPDFLPTLEGLTNSSSRRIHAFELLTETAGIYAAMVAAIAAAQRTVTLETYLFWSGQVADTFVEALCDRARAGVAVKLLFDADGSRHLSRATVKQLRAAGCELRFFRPFRWRQPVQYNHRTHRKLLVIDGVVGFTGGIGVADMWLGPPPWLEVMARLEGGVVGILQGAFFQNWVIAGGALDLGPRYFPVIQDDLAKPLGMVTNSAPIWGDSMVRLLYYAAICSSQRQLWLMSPYFLPGEDTIEALCERARAGVDVRLVVPGPARDKSLPYFASRRLYGDLLEAGVQIYEYQPAMLHAKAMVVDGRWCTFGSTNFDPRSFFLNSELNVSVTDPQVAAAFLAFFEGALARSERVTLAAWRTRPLHDRLIGALGMVIRDQL
ncbi:MAG: phosphatidylserine/phosphatidylglycerophosphate/cardiolipin synthase [Cyanobacteria bacterium RYN_339]|nr:phosphatidylserine/phosphatidylglycerophosphate/cardiolipin synthase [Cyanobacteria bacterium RYN_339]